MTTPTPLEAARNGVFTIKLTREQERYLRKLAKHRRRYDPDYVVGGRQMPWWRKMWRRLARAILTHLKSKVET